MVSSQWTVVEGKKNKGVQIFSDLTRKLSQEKRPYGELTFWPMMLLLEGIGCPVYRDLIPPQPVNAQITDRMLPEVIFFLACFPQSVIQVTGNNLQQEAGRPVDLRNQSAIVIVGQRRWRGCDFGMTPESHKKNPQKNKMKCEYSQILDQNNALIVCLSSPSVISSFCLTPSDSEQR